MSRRIEKFAAPPSFEEAGLEPGQGPIDLQDVSSSRREIWLLKAPASFDGKTLHGVVMNLNGDPVEFSRAADDKKYEALGMASLKENKGKLPYLLVPSGSGKTFEPAPELKGQITIVESLNVPSSDRLPDIEASRAPEIPEGLRQRFRPFGWEEPKHRSNQVTCVSPSSATGPRRRKRRGDVDSSPNQGNGSVQQTTGLETATLERQKSGKKMKRKHEKGEVSPDDAAAKQQTVVKDEDFVSNPKKKKKGQD